MKNCLKEKNGTIYKKDIWLIAIAVLLPSLYNLFNRYFIGYMDFQSILVDQSYESMEVIVEVFLEMLPLTVLALTTQNYKEKDKIRRIVKTSIILQLLVTISFSIISIIGCRAFVDFVNTPIEVQSIATRYFILKSLVLPIHSVWLILSISLKTTNSFKSILLAMFNISINYILDCLLISNFSFSLKLGLTGSALSSILAHSLTLIVALIMFKKEIGFSKDLFTLKLDKEALSPITKIGAFAGLESFVRNLGYLFGVVLIINTLSTESILAFNSVNNIFWAIILVPILAITEAIKFSIGKAHSNGQKHIIINILKQTLILVLSWLIICRILGGISIVHVSNWLNGAIDTTNLNILPTFNTLWVAYVFFAISCIFNSYFCATGKSKELFKVSFVVNLTVYIPFGIMCKLGLLTFNLEQFLILTFVAYALNTLLVVILYKKHINKDSLIYKI